MTNKHLRPWFLGFWFNAGPKPLPKNSYLLHLYWRFYFEGALKRPLWLLFLVGWLMILDGGVEGLAVLLRKTYRELARRR